jgi:hypothetical protein
VSESVYPFLDRGKLYLYLNSEFHRIALGESRNQKGGFRVRETSSVSDNLPYLITTLLFSKKRGSFEVEFWV